MLNNLELLGQKSHELTIVGIIGIVDGRLNIRVRCNCGIEKEIRKASFGTQKTCGHNQRANLNWDDPEISNIVGKKFNKLTILSQLGPWKKTKTRYTYQCDCGNRREVSYGNAVNGLVKSCGTCNTGDLTRARFNNVLCLDDIRLKQIYYAFKIVGRRNRWQLDMDYWNKLESADRLWLGAFVAEYYLGYFPKGLQPAFFDARTTSTSHRAHIDIRTDSMNNAIYEDSEGWSPINNASSGFSGEDYLLIVEEIAKRKEETFAKKSYASELSTDRDILLTDMVDGRMLLTRSRSEMRAFFKRTTPTRTSIQNCIHKLKHGKDRASLHKIEFKYI